MFSFYQIVDYLEEQELQELFATPTIVAIGSFLGLRHLLKKGKERDAMMYCKSECSRIIDRKEWEKCVSDCFERKITIMKYSYKAIKTNKKVSEQTGIQNVSSFNMGDKTPNSPGRTLAANKLRAMTNISPYSSGKKVKGKSLVSNVGGS